MRKMTRSRRRTAWRHQRTMTSGKSPRVSITRSFYSLPFCINGPICLVQVKGARNARSKRRPWLTRRFSKKTTLGIDYGETVRVIGMICSECIRTNTSKCVRNQKEKKNTEKSTLIFFYLCPFNRWMCNTSRYLKICLNP